MSTRGGARALEPWRWLGVPMLQVMALSFLFAIPLRFGWIAPEDPMQQILLICVQVNLSLMCFNLIPIYPLDGSHVVRGLLPTHLAFSYHRFMTQWGMLIMMMLLVAGRGLLGLMIGLPVAQLMGLLIGR